MSIAELTLAERCQRWSKAGRLNSKSKRATDRVCRAERRPPHVPRRAALRLALQLLGQAASALGLTTHRQQEMLGSSSPRARVARRSCARAAASTPPRRPAAPPRALDCTWCGRRRRLMIGLRRPTLPPIRERERRGLILAQRALPHTSASGEKGERQRDRMTHACRR